MLERPTKNDVFKKDVFGGLKRILGPSYFARALAVKRNCTRRSGKETIVRSWEEQ